MNCISCDHGLTDNDEQEYDTGNVELDCKISNIANTVECLLICLDCKNQTPYGYLWFAICDGREHVLTSKHK
jgi:hypothetical protein